MLEPGTVLLVGALMCVAEALGLALLWRAHRHEVVGPGWWFVGMILVGSGALCFASGGHVPSVIAVELGNGLYLGGMAVVLEGHARFAQRPLPTWLRPGLPVVVAPFFVFFHRVSPDFAMRVTLVTVVAVVYLFTLAMLLWQSRSESERLIGRVGGVFAAIAGAAMVPAAVAAWGAPKATMLVESASGTWLSTALAMGLAAAIVTVQILLVGARLGDRLKLTVAELETALSNVRTLDALLKQCAWCRRLREEDGSWSELSRYLANNTDSMVSHGVCPDCLSKGMSQTAPPGPPAPGAS